MQHTSFASKKYDFADRNIINKIESEILWIRNNKYKEKVHFYNVFGDFFVFKKDMHWGEGEKGRNAYKY